MLHLLPSTLTLARLALGVAFPFAAPEWQPWLILIGAATDLVDGRLARFLKADGSTGKYLDPVADKVFAIGVLIAVLRDGLVSPVGIIFLLARDLVVVVGTLTLFAVGRRDVLARMGPSALGKVTTAFQFVYFLFVTWVREPVLPLLVLVAVVTVIAGLDYLRCGLRLVVGVRN